MKHRRMVTFPELGNQLLTRAIGPAGREVAGGDYLTALLTQRMRSWTRAYEALLRTRSNRELLALCRKLQGHVFSYTDRLGDVGQLVGVDLDPAESLQLCDLAEEFSAGNIELRLVLGDTKRTKDGHV